MSAPQLGPGTVVAQKYQIGACLGYAGASATYQAMGADGREVVLKIFDPAIRQRADIMAAIEQTYAATNALPQDIAVPLLDAGYDAATASPFSVGERIAFPSLGQIAAQRPLTPDEVSRLLGVLAHLFDQAHARQLFHHALKPTNVFVGFAQGHGVRVTDFGAGLARAAVPTQEGYAVAAPWLAPEQVQGTSPAGAAADVFAAGLVMFYALTGRSYWRSCQGSVDLPGWQRELSSPRPPPSSRAMELGALLNSAYDGVLGCALSIDPGQRYRSVRELAQAFEALVGVPPQESQATMAFPASALGMPLGGGGYPPPPAPTGGYQAAPGGGAPAQQGYGGLQAPAGALGTAAYPWGPQAPAALQQQAAASVGSGMPQPAQAQPAPASAAPYAASPTAPSQLELAETSAGRPVDPAVMARRPTTPSRLAPILVGVAAVVLLGGAAAAYVVMGKRSHADTPATQASASASASVSSAPSASAAPADSASAAPADTASAAPADSAAAAPADSAAAAADANASTLACDPECDEIKVDDKPIELGKPVTLAPGKHTVLASKSGYLPVRELVTVKAGEKVEKTFKLKEKPAAPASPAPAAAPAAAAPAKPCGKFLKRGAGCK